MNFVHHVVKTFPSIALLLAASIKPIEQALQDIPSKRYYSVIISDYTIVMVIADKHLIYPFDNVYSFSRS